MQPFHPPTTEPVAPVLDVPEAVEPEEVPSVLVRAIDGTIVRVPVLPLD